jgi:hypothetical protein
MDLSLYKHPVAPCETASRQTIDANVNSATMRTHRFSRANASSAGAGRASVKETEASSDNTYAYKDSAAGYKGGVRVSIGMSDAFKKRVAPSALPVAGRSTPAVLHVRKTQS